MKIKDFTYISTVEKSPRQKPRQVSLSEARAQQAALCCLSGCPGPLLCDPLERVTAQCAPDHETRIISRCPLCSSSQESHPSPAQRACDSPSSVWILNGTAFSHFLKQLVGRRIFSFHIKSRNTALRYRETTFEKKANYKMNVFRAKLVLPNLNYENVQN